ncbi:hypothetical protein QTP88_004478 [Uroleucon formosanum]
MSKQTPLSSFFIKPVVVKNNENEKTESNGNEQEIEKDEMSRKKVKIPMNYTYKYIDKYIGYGFTYINENGVNLPICVICGILLANASLKPNKHLRHLETNHNEYRNITTDFFLRKRDELKINKKNIKSYTTVDKVYLKCSFIAAMHIAKTKKPYNIDDTIHKRILCIANDIEYQLVEKINKSLFYAIQLDESTDISNSVILLIYVRYIDYTFNDIKEEFLCTLKLKTFTTADKIFKTMNNGTASMTGIHSGVVSRVKEVAHAHLISTHCFIHREQLAVKDGAINSRIFSVMCKEFGSVYNNVLFHSHIRWLSRGKVLTRFIELRTEIEVFLREKNSPLSDHFQDKIWLAKVTYLSDIFSLLNELNLSMQGPLTNIFTCYNKVEAFLKKLDLWIKRIQENTYDMFPSYYNMTEEKLLKKNEINYFPPSHDIRLNNMWILNPFLPSEKHELSLLNESHLLELLSDKLLEQSFNTKNVNQFWISLSNEYHNLYEEALKKLRISLTYSIEAQIDSLVKQHQDQGSH